MAKSDQLAYGLEVPLKADSVDAPIVQYGGGMTAIHVTTDDGRWGHVTFEGLDSIKISRGECEPFPSAPEEEKGPKRGQQLCFKQAKNLDFLTDFAGK